MEQAQEMRARVAALESKVDFLESELMYLNEILCKSGFPEGITTLKATVEELLQEGVDSALQERFQFPESN